MTSEAADNRAKIMGIKGRMQAGQITYDQAKAEAQPIIDAINAKAKLIAKKYKKRPQLVSFAAIMR
jgi:hypothetical protein